MVTQINNGRCPSAFLYVVLSSIVDRFRAMLTNLVIPQFNSLHTPHNVVPTLL